MKKFNTAKLLPIAQIVTILLFGVLLTVKIFKISSADSITLVNIVSAVGLLSYFIATIMALLKKNIVKPLLMFTPLLSLLLCTMNGGAFISSLMWMSISSLGLAALYQIKVGDVPYWNMIIGEPNSTTTLIEKIKNFFNKSTNQSSDNDISKSIKIGNIIVSIFVVLIVALLIYAWGKVDFKIQWNMFASGMLPIVYIIGLCITIFNPIPTLTSWLVYKDPHTGKELGRKKDYDIIEVLFNTFVYPFLMRFIFYPLVAAAIIYYPIMGVFALIEAIIPILFIIIIVAIIPAYLIYSKIIPTLSNKKFISKFAPFIVIALVSIITLVWLQNTDNKLSNYFHDTETRTVSENIETVINDNIISNDTININQ